MQAKKRFYKDVKSDAGDDGWVIKLDNRTLRSPAGALLHLPSPALAAAVADEWGRRTNILMRPACRYSALR